MRGLEIIQSILKITNVYYDDQVKTWNKIYHKAVKLLLDCQIYQHFGDLSHTWAVMRWCEGIHTTDNCNWAFDIGQLLRCVVFDQAPHQGWLANFGRTDNSYYDWGRLQRRSVHHWIMYLLFLNIQCSTMIRETSNACIRYMIHIENTFYLVIKLYMQVD